MFNKIIIIDNTIAIVKYTIEWQEQMPKGIDEETGEQLFEKVVNTEFLVSDESKNCFIEMLEKRNIHYTITKIDVSAEMEQYNGMEWDKGRDEALLYINGVGKYNPKLIRISELKQFLDTQWRWKNERYYAEIEEIELGLRANTTDSKSQIIVARKTAIDEINALEQEIEKGI